MDLEVARFQFVGTTLTIIAARTPIGLVGAALMTHTLLHAYQPRMVVQIGFGGILSDDLRIGDVAVASQVDCYLTKNKAAPGRTYQSGSLPAEVAFAGEVFRTTLGLVQFAITAIV